MYFPRVPPKLLKPGQVLDVGTRANGNFNIRFCHFFDGRGFEPGMGHETKKCCFFFFSIFSSQVKVK